MHCARNGLIYGIAHLCATMCKRAYSIEVRQDTDSFVCAERWGLHRALWQMHDTLQICNRVFNHIPGEYIKVCDGCADGCASTLVSLFTPNNLSAQEIGIRIQAQP